MIYNTEQFFHKTKDGKNELYVPLNYLDSLSRVNALRQLKKTTKFFEQFMPYKGGFHKKYSSEIELKNSRNFLQYPHP